MGVKNGTIESREWPATVQARIVGPGAAPTIHGYALHDDLAKHYRFADIVLLSLTGELDPVAGAALDVVLRFACATSVADAPTHAATLAKLCGSRVSGIVSIAATGLAEQSRAILDEHERVIPRLVIGSLNGMAKDYAARDEDERHAVEALRQALGSFTARVPALGYDIRIDTAIVAVLLGCGLREREHLELALTLARLPVACAEAFAAETGAFKEYAINTPAFVYTGAST
jgi:hypothetical protein